MSEQNLETTRPAGYAALIQRYGLEVIPNWHRSLVATSGSHRVETTGEIALEVYPAKYWPGDSLGDQLEFALKYDGTNLGILDTLFHVAGPQPLLSYVRSKPTGKYARRLWYLYELLSGEALPLDDLKQGNYISLLDPQQYYTLHPARPVRRQRIHDNLLGDRRFCPTIRRTEKLDRYEGANLPNRCQQVVATYAAELLKRALSYLYSKETKSSFEIEQIEPNATRTQRFMGLLQQAEREDFCDQARLVELQNRIVDPRFRAANYRDSQNYVGETVAWRHEKVHFVGPSPKDLPELMAGLIGAHQRMDQPEMSAVAHAAVVAYGFVFLHPFEDGNGRIHRFLIHNILARRGFTPQGIMFPVSAAMLKNPADYDASLEAFSRPLMALVEYSLDTDGRMTVEGDTSTWYRYIDMTAQTEALFEFIERTIDSELAQELDFLANYDQTKQAIQQIVDMPDRQIDLFIRFCLQNHGRLSAAKRTSHFNFLSSAEVERMQQAVERVYGKSGGQGQGA